MKIKATRAQLRGAMLLPDCYRARITKHECGLDDERCYCLGLFDEDRVQLEKCYACGAFALHATFPKEDNTK